MSSDRHEQPIWKHKFKDHHEESHGCCFLDMFKDHLDESSFMSNWKCDINRQHLQQQQQDFGNLVNSSGIRCIPQVSSFFLHILLQSRFLCNRCSGLVAHRFHLLSIQDLTTSSEFYFYSLIYYQNFSCLSSKKSSLDIMCHYWWLNWQMQHLYHVMCYPYVSDFSLLLSFSTRILYIPLFDSKVILCASIHNSNMIYTKYIALRTWYIKLQQSLNHWLHL